MKRLFLQRMRLLICLFVVGLTFIQPESTFAQKLKSKKVPLELLKAFRDQYPAATEVEWRRLKVGFEASYEYLGREQRSVYNPQYQWQETRAGMNQSELAFNTTLLLKERFPDCQFDQLILFETPESREHQVRLKCQKQFSFLVFDESGRLLREELGKTDQSK
jgi:hypothetical protein